MFAFMLDEPPAEVEIKVLSDDASAQPQPVCIHNCNTPNPERGYCMNSRRQKYICPNCLEDFDQQCRVDRVARNLHVFA
jgi:hypothetical protein